MLREPEFFNPLDTLPDVSKVAAPTANASASALAGINSGADYAKAIYAAAYRPLTATNRQQQETDFDQSPIAQTPAYKTHDAERRNISRMLRNAVGGGSRPTYTAPSYDGPAAPLPGTEGPVASEAGGPNILGQPPPDDSLFPTAPNPILPPPVSPEEPWNPADIFKHAY